MLLSLLRELRGSCRIDLDNSPDWLSNMLYFHSHNRNCHPSIALGGDKCFHCYWLRPKISASSCLFRGGVGRGSEPQIFPSGEHPSPQLISVQASTQKGTSDELLRQSPCVVQASGYGRLFSQQHILVLYRLEQGAIWVLVSSVPSAK